MEFSKMEKSVVKKLKMERRYLYLELSNCVLEHDQQTKEHEVGTEPECALCVRYNRLKEVLDEKEGLTKMIDKANNKK